MNHNYFSAALLIGILVMGQDLAEIPADLTFSCEGRPYGYYADPATNCQVFHICLGDGDIKWSFLCPNQTIFNQVSHNSVIIVPFIQRIIMPIYPFLKVLIHKGLCTNHVDRILGNFDPPPPYVDTFTK